MFSSKTNALFSTCKLGDSHTARTDCIKDLRLVTYSKLYFHFIPITFFFQSILDAYTTNDFTHQNLLYCDSLDSFVISAQDYLLAAI